MYYLVTAGGGRRLAMLRRAKRNQIKKSEPMRCWLDTANDPSEISLDENVTRTPMHPADQFERFAELSNDKGWGRSEEHTSELQSLMRISYAVFCLKKTHTTIRLAVYI